MSDPTPKPLDGDPAVENASSEKPILRKKRNRGTGTAAALAITAMARNGIPVSKASEMLGLNPSTGYRMMQKQAGEAGTSALLSAVRDEKLCALVDNFLDKGIKMKAGKIKASDSLGAAKLYADRRYPLKQDQNGGTQVSFVTVNIGSVADASPPPLDITPPEQADPVAVGDGI